MPRPLHHNTSSSASTSTLIPSDNARTSCSLEPFDAPAFPKSKSQKSASMPSRKKPTFLQTLYALLETTTSRDLIFWSPCGNYIIISDETEFVKQIASKLFRQGKIESFTKQMNNWKFNRDHRSHKHPDPYIRNLPDNTRIWVHLTLTQRSRPADLAKVLRNPDGMAKAAKKKGAAHSPPPRRPRRSKMKSAFAHQARDGYVAEAETEQDDIDVGFNTPTLSTSAMPPITDSVSPYSTPSFETPTLPPLTYYSDSCGTGSSGDEFDGVCTTASSSRPYSPSFLQLTENPITTLLDFTSQRQSMATLADTNYIPSFPGFNTATGSWNLFGDFPSTSSIVVPSSSHDFSFYTPPVPASNDHTSYPIYSAPEASSSIANFAQPLGESCSRQAFATPTPSHPPSTNALRVFISPSPRPQRATTLAHLSSIQPHTTSTVPGVWTDTASASCASTLPPSTSLSPTIGRGLGQQDSLVDLFDSMKASNCVYGAPDDGVGTTAWDAGMNGAYWSSE